MIIDEVRQVEMEEHIEDDNDEEEEDLSNIPLFESCDEIEETSSIFQSSVTFSESDSAPQAATSLLLDSDMRQGADVWRSVIKNSASRTSEHQDQTCYK